MQGTASESVWLSRTFGPVLAASSSDTLWAFEKPPRYSNACRAFHTLGSLFVEGSPHVVTEALLITPLTEYENSLLVQQLIIARGTSGE